MSRSIISLINHKIGPSEKRNYLKKKKKSHIQNNQKSIRKRSRKEKINSIVNWVYVIIYRETFYNTTNWLQSYLLRSLAFISSEGSLSSFCDRRTVHLFPLFTWTINIPKYVFLLKGTVDITHNTINKPPKKYIHIYKNLLAAYMKKEEI